MNTASHVMDTESGAPARATEAWTAFWADHGQSSCATGAPEIWQALADHWSSFARSLAHGTPVLDLGCGACAVGRLVAGARSDLHVTGIDAARVPSIAHPQIAVLSHTAMEHMPFTERRFGAAVSQFGYEYSHTVESAREIARVLAPGAKLSFLVHHAESAIVDATGMRLRALDDILGAMVCTAFCAGDVAALNSQISGLMERHPDDNLVAQLARALPQRMGQPQAKRLAIWAAIEEALAPERRVSESLKSSCVAASQIDEWSGPLRTVCELKTVSVLREANGVPIAWIIEGSPRYPS